MRVLTFSMLGWLACFNVSPVQAAEMKTFSDRLNAFGFHLAQGLQSSERRNLLISPASIALALGMVYAGATGETAEAMGGVLGLDNSSRETALHEFAALLATLDHPGSGVTLKVANAAWIDSPST